MRCWETHQNDDKLDPFVNYVHEFTKQRGTKSAFKKSELPLRGCLELGKSEMQPLKALNIQSFESVATRYNSL